MPDGNRIIIGRNAVKEALKNGSEIHKLLIQKGAGGSIQEIIDMAGDRGLRIDFVPKEVLDKSASGKSHQGSIAYLSDYKYWDLDRVVENAGENSVLIVLDEIEDPHNLGAIMRTAECTGADGIIISKHRSVGITETVAKTSAGAVEYMPCVRVTNIAKTLDELKDAGYWVYAADMDGISLWDCDLRGKIALVIGNEGKGVSRLVKEKCDVTVSIPMDGRLDSLNASNAAAVILYEAFRQRTRI